MYYSTFLFITSYLTSDLSLSPLSLLFSEEEQFSRDGGEGEAVEKEEHRTRHHRQASGGESSQTAGGQPESGEKLFGTFLYSVPNILINYLILVLPLNEHSVITPMLKCLAERSQ